MRSSEIFDKLIENNEKLSESYIRLEETGKQIARATDKIAEAHTGIQQAVESLNDTIHNNTRELEETKNGCQLINLKRELRYHRLVIYLISIIVAVLGFALGVKLGYV